MPLTFEANVGQVDRRVSFLTHSGGASVFLTSDRIVVTLTRRPAESPAKGRARLDRALGPSPAADGVALDVTFVGANPAPNITGLDEQPGKVNYFMVIGVGSLGVAAGPAAVGIAGGAGTGIAGTKQC